MSIGIARDGDGEAVVIAPLAVERRASLRLARFVANGPADELGPLSADGVSPAATADALVGHVRATLGDSGLFLGERLWGGSALAREFASAVVHRVPSPVLPIAGAGFADFLDSRSRNFRSQVRRHERRLQSAGQVTYRLCEDPNRLEADMHTLMRLHAARWGETGAFSAARAPFHLDFARRALERGWLRLWMLELDQRPVAAWYGLRYDNIDFYYQAGREPAYDRLAVGFVLLNHTIRCAFEDGMHEYRFGRGGEAYKGRYTDHDPGLDTIAIASGVRGNVALAAIRTLLRMPVQTRRAIRGVID